MIARLSLPSFRPALLVALMGATLVVTGCQTNVGDGTNDGPNPADAPVVSQVTQTAMKASSTRLAKLEEVPGTYEGVLPCADCEGIATTYHIHNDGTFTTVERYQGTKEVFKSSGRWQYRNGVLFMVDSEDPHPYMVRAEDGQIRLLDANGKANTGELADHYVLKKIR